MAKTERIDHMRLNRLGRLVEGIGAVRGTDNGTRRPLAFGRFDQGRDGRDLLAWLEQAGLIPADVAMRFREMASPEVLDDIAARACGLREWFRAFVSAHAGRRLAPAALADVDKINRLLARDETYRQIEPRAAAAPDALGASLHWRRHRRWRAPEDLLLPIAEAMGDLICHADFSRVKNCEGPTCTMWFHDVSKNHTRRWCSMAVCGNRAKAAAHRAKKRAVRSS